MVCSRFSRRMVPSLTLLWEWRYRAYDDKGWAVSPATRSKHSHTEQHWCAVAVMQLMDWLTQLLLKEGDFLNFYQVWVMKNMRIVWHYRVDTSNGETVWNIFSCASQPISNRKTIQFYKFHHQLLTSDLSNKIMFETNNCKWLFYYVKKLCICIKTMKLIKVSFGLSVWSDCMIKAGNEYDDPHTFNSLFSGIIIHFFSPAFIPPCWGSAIFIGRFVSLRESAALPHRLTLLLTSDLSNKIMLVDFF